MIANGSRCRLLAGLLEELGHRVEHVDHPPAPASFVDDFVLYWGFLALAQVRSGRRTFGRTFDPTRLDELTLGPRAEPSGLLRQSSAAA